jgi:immune inhibitor A
MNKSSLIALVGGVVFALCCVCAVGAGAVAIYLNGNETGTVFSTSPDAPPTADRSANDRPRRITATPQDESEPTPEPDVTLDAQTPAEVPPAKDVAAEAPSTAESTAYEKLRDTILPRERLTDLAIRFKGVKPEDTRVTCTEERSLRRGATRTFTLSNQDSNTQFDVTARLAAVTDHVYMWVQSDPNPVEIDEQALARAADIIERKIYPVTREFFGSEDLPGVDCDRHIHMVHAQGVGDSVGGYFSSPDAYPKIVRSDSNEGQVFVLHAAPGFNGSDPESDVYLSTVAHEFQHMISFANYHSPDLWLEEGAAHFAERLNGYGSKVGTIFEFAARPEIQLNTWEDSSAGANRAHYGAGYLFWSYLYDRFGENLARKLARAPERSEAGVLDVLRNEGITNPDTGKVFTFEELFADFVVANYMSRTKIEPTGNRYNYTSLRVPPFAERASYNARDYPLNTSDSLNQFGTHYIELTGDKSVTLNFSGDKSVKLLPMSEARGQFWYSNRGDSSNPRLTREFDLTGALAATLKFRAWYRLEDGYDYAYVSASTDGGKTWKLLKTKTCTTANPQNANLGCGWNKGSGVRTMDAEPRWVNEEADLKEYVGKVVQLRFETVTDAGVNREGLAIDDIEIPEINFKDDVESNDDSAWVSEGWVRSDNTLPQRWSVRAIVTRRDGKRELVNVPVDNGTGSATFDLSRQGGVRTIILVINPITQVTTEPANYQLRVE